MAVLLVPLIAYGVWYWWPPYRPAWWATIKVGDPIGMHKSNMDGDYARGFWWTLGSGGCWSSQLHFLAHRTWHRRFGAMTITVDASDTITELEAEEHDFGPTACWDQARDRLLAPAAFGLRKLILGY